MVAFDEPKETLSLLKRTKRDDCCEVGRSRNHNFNLDKSATERDYRGHKSGSSSGTNCSTSSVRREGLLIRARACHPEWRNSATLGIALVTPSNRDHALPIIYLHLEVEPGERVRVKFPRICLFNERRIEFQKLDSLQDLSWYRICDFFYNARNSFWRTAL